MIRMLYHFLHSVLPAFLLNDGNRTSLVAVHSRTTWTPIYWFSFEYGSLAVRGFEYLPGSDIAAELTLFDC